jgi:L-ascorbate metabolism protein UlaG (beta-lactamase superfamily)
MDITWLGHSAFLLEDGGTTLLIDPFLNGNPKAARSADDVNPDVILLTHGHQDHYGDTVDIAKRTGATVVAITEVAGEIGGKLGEDHEVFDPNMGGTVTFDWGWVKMTPAWHTGTTPDGTVHTPAGLLISFGGKVVYHLGDTALFSDLKLVAERGDQIDVAIIPIGGHYTMDRIDAAVAAEFVGARQVIPCHYGTFPPIETDPEAFKSDVENSTASEVIVLEPGGTHSA